MNSSPGLPPPAVKITACIAAKISPSSALAPADFS